MLIFRMFLCDLCVHIYTNQFVGLFVCRSEMETWCVCGSLSESAWLNTPPPSAPGPTARGFVGLFREELHASLSIATTRSLIFPPYLSQPIKSGAINGWPSWCRENFKTFPKQLLWFDAASGWLFFFVSVWSPMYSSTHFPYRFSSAMMNFFKEELKCNQFSSSLFLLPVQDQACDTFSSPSCEKPLPSCFKVLLLLFELLTEVYSMFLFESVPRCLVFPWTGCWF